MNFIRLRFHVLFIAAVYTVCALVAPAYAEDVPLGDLEIWHDEVPIKTPEGSSTWVVGKTVIPLKWDAVSGVVSGSGPDRYTIKSQYSAKSVKCLSSAVASRNLTVKGKSALGSLDVEISSTSSSGTIEVNCAGIPLRQPFSAPNPGIAHVVIALSSTQPVKMASSFGPGVFVQFKGGCDLAQPTSALLPVTTQPAASSWHGLTPQRLTTLTLDDIRKQPWASANAVGLTRPHLQTKHTLKDNSKPGRGGGTCYWVEKVEFIFDPIEVLIPGLNWGQGTCEFKAIDEHEQKHVRTFNTMLGEYSRELVKVVQTGGLPQADRPSRVNSAAEGRVAAEKRIADLADPLRDKYLKRREQLAQQIDTDTEYRSVHDKCRAGWR